MDAMALGRKPELAWLPVGKLSVDPKYQRNTSTPRSKNLIAKISEGFRWSRFGVALVVKRGGGWHVIDGQHRVEACRLRGDIPHVPAVILPHATVEEAAADFVAINRDRVNITPLAVHAAMLTAKNPQALATARVCEAAGVTICRYPVSRKNIKAGETLAVATIARLVRLRGEDFTIKVLQRVLEDSSYAPGALSAGAIRNAALEVGLSDRHYISKPRLASRGAGTRNCLCCQKPFLSDGPFNRMCNTCKAAA